MYNKIFCVFIKLTNNNLIFCQKYFSSLEKVDKIMHSQYLEDFKWPGIYLCNIGYVCIFYTYNMYLTFM